MKFTNEQYEVMGNNLLRVCAGEVNSAIIGRAAVAAVAPLLLAELQHASDVEWSSLATYYQVKGLFLISFADLNVFLRNRLASVTAKPDPRVEVVLRELYGDIGAVHAEDRRRVAERLLAALDAVDAARAK